MPGTQNSPDLLGNDLLARRDLEAFWDLTIRNRTERFACLSSSDVDGSSVTDKVRQCAPACYSLIHSCFIWFFRVIFRRILRVIIAYDGSDQVVPGRPWGRLSRLIVAVSIPPEALLS